MIMQDSPRLCNRDMHTSSFLIKEFSEFSFDFFESTQANFLKIYVNLFDFTKA